MRAPARIDRILSLLQEVWSTKENSDLRLGQLLINILPEGRAMWNLEDSELEDLIRKVAETGKFRS